MAAVALLFYCDPYYFQATRASAEHKGRTHLPDALDTVAHVPARRHDYREAYYRPCIGPDIAGKRRRI